jgi:hypothetical protein
MGYCQDALTYRGEKMDTEQLRQALQDRIISRVADGAGVNYWTLLRFANGETTPRAQTLDKLRKYFVAGPTSIQRSDGVQE